MSEVQPDPPELPSGQDDGEPDLRLAVAVAILLLRDIRDHLTEEDEDPTAADLLLRIGAVLRVLQRIKEGLDT